MPVVVGQQLSVCYWAVDPMQHQAALDIQDVGLRCEVNGRIAFDYHSVWIMIEWREDQINGDVKRQAVLPVPGKKVALRVMMNQMNGPNLATPECSPVAWKLDAGCG